MNERCCCGSNRGFVKTLGRLVLILSCFIFLQGRTLQLLFVCGSSTGVTETLSCNSQMTENIYLFCLCTHEHFSCLCEMFWFLICTLRFCLISIPRCASGCFWGHIINKTGSTVCRDLSFRSRGVLLQTVQIWT